MKNLLHSLVPHLRLARALANLRARRAYFWAALWLGALTFVSQPAHAAGTEAWVQRYNNVVSNAIDRAVKVVRDAAGDIIGTGTTHDNTSGDMLTIKYSGADGSTPRAARALHSLRGKKGTNHERATHG